MKRIYLITAMLASMMFASSVSISAQEENGFKVINVRTDFKENGFDWYRKALLLAAGNKKASNAMTIGWGGIGTLWGRTSATVYVAEKRYTKVFMDKEKYFTIMAFSDEKVLEYMGTKSGRDGDKAKALGLHTAYTTNGTPFFIEADMVLECRTMYVAPFDKRGFKDDVPTNFYKRFPAGIHSMYIGEVVGAWIK
jgi:flavin reductase (DIM6/NTAB) family NADH-FMN oxidoreductase RutF